AGIAPLIGHAGTPGIEPVIIGIVGVAAIVAVHVAREAGAERAAQHHAGNGPDRLPTAAAAPATGDGVSENSADQRSRDDTARVALGAAFAIIIVVLVAILALILVLPAPDGIVIAHIARWRKIDRRRIGAAVVERRLGAKIIPAVMITVGITVFIGRP